MNRLDEQLFELNRELIEMGALCEEAIASATDALLKGDTELAAKVRENGAAVDRMERDIEGRCVKLLLHRQPVARDLRMISSALKMITDMERIGDQAEDIAEIVTFLNGRTDFIPETIGEMARRTTEMVKSGVAAFVERDIVRAKAVIAADDAVDDCFIAAKNDIIRLIARDPEEGGFALDLLMISKYLERIGDHAVNLAEWVIYSVTGTHEEEKR
ncbi:MAG: phosphate signaling complex protein PhoU [Clostridia bacterium]|nr:phosphate signaling complex protein PhoU [Clostridia bacterium]